MYIMIMSFKSMKYVFNQWIFTNVFVNLNTCRMNYNCVAYLHVHEYINTYGQLDSLLNKKLRKFERWSFRQQETFANNFKILILCRDFVDLSMQSSCLVVKRGIISILCV